MGMVLLFNSAFIVVPPGGCKSLTIDPPDNNRLDTHSYYGWNDLLFVIIITRAGSLFVDGMP